MKRPAFQFYPDDFIGGTCDMTAEEVGTYIRLLCYQWGRGVIPHDDPDKLARIAGADVSDDVLSKFVDGRNPKMEDVRNKLTEFRKKCSEVGKKGGNPAFKKGSTNPYYHNGDDKGIDKGRDMGKIKDGISGKISSPTPTPTPTPTLTPTISPLNKLNKARMDGINNLITDFEKESHKLTQLNDHS